VLLCFLGWPDDCVGGLRRWHLRRLEDRSVRRLLLVPCGAVGCGGSG